MVEKRKFIRHLLVSPLEYKVESDDKAKMSETIDISEGGLLFMAKESVSSGTKIDIHMPLYE